MTSDREVYIISPRNADVTLVSPSYSAPLISVPSFPSSISFHLYSSRYIACSNCIHPTTGSKEAEIELSHTLDVHTNDYIRPSSFKKPRYLQHDISD